MRILIPILLLLSLFACSPERKLAKLIKKNPELVRHDTIYRSDTTIVNGVQHDTIFKTQITKDTIVIKEKQLTIKYYNDGKTTYLKGICDTVWAIKEVPIIVNSVNPVQEVHVIKWWDWLAYAISLLAILFIILDRWAAKRGSTR